MRIVRLLLGAVIGFASSHLFLMGSHEGLWSGLGLLALFFLVMAINYRDLKLLEAVIEELGAELNPDSSEKTD